MMSPLMLKKCGCRSKQTAKVLCTVLCAFVLLCTVSVQGQESVVASRVLYPQSLDFQLRRIAESPAECVQPLRETCFAILDDLNAVVTHIEQNPAELCPELQHLEKSYQDWERLRESWDIKVSTHPDEPSYIPSTTALEEISLALQRRIFIWKSLFKAEVAEASPIVTLYEKSFADVERLRERTLAVDQYFSRFRAAVEFQAGQTWRDYLETQSWITELEACRPPADPTIRRVSLSTAPSIPAETLRTFSHRANVTVARLESPTLTNSQRTFLSYPVVNAWKEELQSWRADTVDPTNLLRFVERYEENGGMSDMRALARYIGHLTISKTPEYRELGENVRLQYGMANTQFFVSSALLNNHLPKTEPEIAAFREIIVSQPTVGRRQTETEFAVSLIPHPTRILTSLDIGIDLATVSRSDAFATQLFNMGQTRVIAQKTIELTEKGFLTEPCRAKIVAHRMRLVRINTDFDDMPILSGVFRGVVRNQYEDKRYEAITETQRKILRRVRNQVDWETAQRLQPINERIQMLAQYAEEEFGLRVKGRESRTDENWLLSAWDIYGNETLSGNTPAPETLPGSFADLKVHDSLPNMFLGKLELEGKRGTVGEFKEMLAERFKQPGLAAPEENDHVVVTFASYNPMVVRFVDGRIELTISLAALRLLGKTHRDFQVIVRYKPAYDSEGRLVLERDGYISLINVNVREQFLMRTVFGKIFPVSRPVPLVPKVLEKEGELDYLTTGHCRIEKGWFALALVEKDE